MTGVRETHQRIEITQDESTTHVVCDCGWNVGLTAPLIPSPLGELGRQKADMAQARKLWREHKCGAA